MPLFILYERYHNFYPVPFVFFTFCKWLMDEQPEQNQGWRRMPLLPCGNCILRASQELRENSCSSSFIAESMLSWVWAPEIYPESPNPVHMWRLMWFKQHSDLPRIFWAEDGHSAPLPCQGKCSEVIKTTIFAAVLQHWRPGSSHALSPRSSRGYCGLEQCQGQSPLGNVTDLPRLPVRDCHSELARPALCLATSEAR